MIENLFPNVDWTKMWEATVETLYMTAVSTLLTFIIGLALGFCFSYRVQVNYGQISWSILLQGLRQYI